LSAEGKRSFNWDIKHEDSYNAKVGGFQKNVKDAENETKQFRKFGYEDDGKSPIAVLITVVSGAN